MTGRIVRNIVLAVALFYVASPFLLAFAVSAVHVSEPGRLAAIGSPPAVDGSAWRMAWSGACVGETCAGLHAAMVNSVWIVAPALLATSALGIVAGFAIGCHHRSAPSGLYAMLAFAIFVPAQVLIYPTILLTKSLGLFSSLPGAILVHTIWGFPIVTFLFSAAFSNIPKETIRAARLDGANFLSLLLNIAIPQSLIQIGSVILLQFTFLWNDFIVGYTFAGDANRPVSVWLDLLSSTQYGHVDYSVNIAAALVSAAPAVAVYALLYGLTHRADRTLRAMP